MLVLPDTGFRPSVNQHNVDIDSMCDWIEGSIVFIDDNISHTDVMDILFENHIYSNQTRASVLITDAWDELDRRSKKLGKGAPFRINARRIVRQIVWQEVPAYSFSLLLAIHGRYPAWSSLLGESYIEQGLLFERLTEECMSKIGWKTFLTGWSAANAGGKGHVVARVANHLKESEIPGAVKTWISAYAKDEGLDLVCTKPFNDDQGGRPAFFIQCASGSNWSGKIHTPDPEVWRRVIDFTTIPQRGMSMPFALSETDFKRFAGRVNGVMLDRFRLSTPAYEGDTDWLTAELKKEILAWMRRRVGKLPVYK